MIACVRFEFTCAGINGADLGPHPLYLPERTHHPFVGLCKMGKLSVGEAKLLCSEHALSVKPRKAHLCKVASDANNI